MALKNHFVLNSDPPLSVVLIAKLECTFLPSLKKKPAIAINTFSI